MGRLSGKGAIISGGARGQGTEEARLFASEGAEVIIGDILDSEGIQVESEIVEQSGQAKFVRLDVSIEDDWSKAVQLAISEYGKLDILVNNTGILLMIEVEDTSTEEWNYLHNINSKGVFLGSKAVIAAMRESGGGSIAVNHGHENSICNSVHPGIIDTDMVSEMIGNKEGRDLQLNRTPLNVIANSRDVAFGVLYLASDESRYVTASNWL